MSISRRTLCATYVEKYRKNKQSDYHEIVQAFDMAKENRDDFLLTMKNKLWSWKWQWNHSRKNTSGFILIALLLLSKCRKRKCIYSCINNTKKYNNFYLHITLRSCWTTCKKKTEYRNKEFIKDAFCTFEKSIELPHLFPCPVATPWCALIGPWASSVNRCSRYHTIFFI